MSRAPVKAGAGINRTAAPLAHHSAAMARLASLPLLLLLAAACTVATDITTTTLPTPPPPPVWPARFSANLTETIRLFNRITVARNPGRWFYDFAARRMRFDHLRPQWDPLCLLQGLSPRRPHADCHLLFAADGLFVHYPGARRCCRACGRADGCSVLRPDWLRSAQFAGTKEVGGQRCRGWKVRGAYAEDYWYEAADGSACQYYEAYTLVGLPLADKSLTFDHASYNTAPIAADVFKVPDYCRRPCRVSYRQARSRRWFRGAAFRASGL